MDYISLLPLFFYELKKRKIVGLNMLNKVERKLAYYSLSTNLLLYSYLAGSFYFHVGLIFVSQVELRLQLNNLFIADEF